MVENKKLALSYRRLSAFIGGQMPFPQSQSCISDSSAPHENKAPTPIGPPSSRRCRATITPGRIGLALAGMRPPHPLLGSLTSTNSLFLRRMALFVHLLQMHNPAQPSTISTRKYEPALGPVSIRSKHLGFDRPGRTGLRPFPDATPAPGPSERNSPLSPVLLQLVMQRLQTDA